MRRGLALGLTQPPSSAMLNDLFIPKSFSVLAKERGAGENLPPSHSFQRKIELECADKKKQQHNLEGSGKGAAGAMLSCQGGKKKPLKQPKKKPGRRMRKIRHPSRNKRRSRRKQRS